MSWILAMRSSVSARHAAATARLGERHAEPFDGVFMSRSLSLNASALSRTPSSSRRRAVRAASFAALSKPFAGKVLERREHLIAGLAEEQHRVVARRAGSSIFSSPVATICNTCSGVLPFRSSTEMPMSRNALTASYSPTRQSVVLVQELEPGREQFEATARLLRDRLEDRQRFDRDARPNREVVQLVTEVDRARRRRRPRPGSFMAACSVSTGGRGS
jgi:hypothetical protein